MASTPFNQTSFNQAGEATDAAITSGVERFPVRLLLATLLGYLLFLPQQFSFETGGIVLPPYRIFLLAMIPLILAEALRGHLRSWIDLVVLFAATWIAVALTITMGAERAIAGAGAQFVDIALSYLFARICIRSSQDLRILLILLAPGLLLAGLMLAAESISRQYLIQPLASAITGGSATTFEIATNIRLGLLRATGPFPHPILAGLFMTSFISLYVLSGIRGFPRIVGALSGAAGFFTLSSAALLGLTVTIVLLAYDWLVSRIVNLTWKLGIAVGTIVLLVVETATNSGAIGLIMRFASLNQVSAFYRRLIWRYGSESVAAHPWFGIGYNEWERAFWMNSSVDNYWLLLAIQYGLLTPVLLVIAVICAVIALARSTGAKGRADAACLRGLAISLSIVALAAFSVSLWLSMQVWFFMLLGMAVTLGARVAPAPVARESHDER